MNWESRFYMMGHLYSLIRSIMIIHRSLDDVGYSKHPCDEPCGRCLAGTANTQWEARMAVAKIPVMFETRQLESTLW